MESGFKKCVGIVIYHTDVKKGKFYQLYQVAVHTKNGDVIPLLTYEGCEELAYKYATFDGMYSVVLSILRENKFYTGFYDDFGVRWYDIMWINKYDCVIERYGKYMGSE